MKNLIFTLILCNYLCSTIAQDTPIFQESEVWTFNEEGYWPYHVPGIMVTKKGTVLAYADARYDDPGDFGPHDIALKRSTDYGESWGKNTFIVKGHHKEIYLFPNAIQPRGSDSIVFIYTQKDPEYIHTKTHVFVKYSPDDGFSWSEPVEISQSLIDQELIMKKEIAYSIAGNEFDGENQEVYGREQFYTGPGNIIQLSETHPVAPNRLIVPLLVIKHRNLPELMDRGMGNAFLISDDNGRTWKAGGTVPIGHLPNSEPSIVELSNGDVLMNARVEQHSERVISISKDGGITWSKSVLDDSIPQFFATHAGMVRMTSPYIPMNYDTPILFSFPNAGYRENMTVMASFDETLSWPVKKVIFDGASYYSNMAVLPDGSCLLIYGKLGTQGADKSKRKTPQGNHPSFPDTNVVARFNLAWLLK